MVAHRGGNQRPPALNVFKHSDETELRVRVPPPWLTDLSVLSLCNFVLGHALAFPETFFSYTLVENFSPTVVQLIYCVLYSPWIAKPLYARIMDKGKSPIEVYVQRLLPMSALIWLTVLIASDLNTTLCLFVLDAFVISFADVALDTIMVKRAKLEADEREVQSHVLIWRSVGMMVGAYSGGLVMNTFGGVAVYACCIVEAVVFCAFAYLLSDVRVGQTSSEPTGRFRDNMTRQLRQALMFTVLVHSVPDLSGLYDFVLIEELHFTPVVIGSLDMIGYIAMSIGAVGYNMAFKGNSNMRMVQIALIVVGLECIIPVAVILHWNRAIGMADITLASIDGFFRAASQRMLVMPITGAIMPYCAVGHEGTIYAMFTALSNVATIIAMGLGSAMSAAAGLERGKMDTLWILFIVRGACFIMLAPAARMLPDKLHTFTEQSQEGHNSKLMHPAAELELQPPERVE